MDSSEEDFWNSSNLTQQNFFDDDEDISFPETDVLGTVVQKSVILPIHSIVSNKSLKIILNANSVVHHANITPKKTVRKMFQGESCVLASFKTLTSKLELLDEAIEIADGNVITTVIIFLNKTLNTNIFYTQLSKRKVAVKHYANYLIEKNNLQQLADLYMATGNVSGMKDIYYLLAKDVSNQNALYKKLEQFNMHHSQNLCTMEDALEIQENLSFLEFQMNHRLVHNSVVDLLLNLCKSELNGGNNCQALKKQFKVDAFQYDWVVMSVLCKSKNWDQLEATFHKTVWVMKKFGLKTVIRPKLFVIGISRYNPPEDVLRLYLTCVGDSSESLYLAKKLKIHSYVIDRYAEQKDKNSLMSYMKKMDLGSSSTQNRPSPKS